MPKVGKTTKSNAAVSKTANSKKVSMTSTEKKPLVGSLSLSAKTFALIEKNWRFFAGILLIYLILNIVFASGVGSIANTVANIKADLNNTSTSTHPLASGVSGVVALIFSGGSNNNAASSALQSFLILLESLVIIWSLRQLLAGRSVGVKQAYYNATAPLVQFLLVLIVIFLQLLPVTFGSAIIAAVSNSLGVVSASVTIIFTLIFILLAAWSAYMISSSAFALYIVTLPDMKPREALRSAKKLVSGRRWQVIGRVAFLPILIVAFMSLIIVPLILYATFLVVPVFYCMSVFALLFTHTYLYSLYRELLG